MNQKVAKADELFFVVDEHDQPLEPLPRKLVHGHGVWHRVSHIWLQNDKGQLLCQQRSLEKELLPGFWECFFGGHSRPGESYEETAQRELREELGLDIAAKEFHFWKVHKFSESTGYNNEFMGIFVVRWNGDASRPTFEDGEVTQIAWKDAATIRRAILSEGGKSWTNIGYELQLLDELAKGDFAIL